MTIDELARRAGVPSINAAVAIGQARAALETVMAADAADRVLNRVVARSMRSSRPLEAIAQQVAFLVMMAHGQATKRIHREPAPRANPQHRDRRRYVRRARQSS